MPIGDSYSFEYKEICFSIQPFSFSPIDSVTLFPTESDGQAKSKSANDMLDAGNEQTSLYPDLSVPTSQVSFPDVKLLHFSVSDFFTELFTICGYPPLSRAVRTAYIGALWLKL